MSRDYVGEIGGDDSLLWPTAADGEPELDDATVSIADAVERLATAGKLNATKVLADMLDHLDASGRFALLKLATGALRVGISRGSQSRRSRMRSNRRRSRRGGVARPWTALSRTVRLGGGTCPAADCRRRSRIPAVHARAPARGHETFAHRLCRRVEVGRYPRPARAGRRQTRLYSRTGDDISGSFPEIAAVFDTTGVLDGELLVRGSDQGGADLHGGAAASFNALQQRLGRKNVSQKMLGAYPAFVRLYDILFDGAEDLRELPWSERRKRLEAFVARLDPDRFDLSQLIEAESFEELEELRGQRATRRSRG